MKGEWNYARTELANVCDIVAKVLRACGDCEHKEIDKAVAKVLELAMRSLEETH